MCRLIELHFYKKEISLKQREKKKKKRKEKEKDKQKEIRSKGFCGDYPIHIGLFSKYFLRIDENKFARHWHAQLLKYIENDSYFFVQQFVNICHA